MNTHQIFSQIESIYHTLNIYKSVLVFNNDSCFLPLKEMLMRNDYSLTSVIKGGRMYDVNVKALKEAKIDWESISLVICLDEESYNHVKTFNDNYSNLNLIIRI